MSSKNRPNILIYAAPGADADALYFGQVETPDPFVMVRVRGRKIALANALEFGRVRRTGDFDSVLPLEAFQKRARETWRRRPPGPAQVTALLARDLKAAPLTVSAAFPVGLYGELRRLGIALRIAEGALFPEREIKSAAEAGHIREGNRCAAAGIAAAEAVLRASRIKRGRLLYEGRTLTSERLKFAIESACLEHGSTPNAPIAAGGDQACDPHDRGSGPLRPGELIIVDVFPRVSATGFHGDMTRTFLKGRASEAQRALVAAVRQAQRKALSEIRAGVNGSAVHKAVTELLISRGYETRHTLRGSVGFFHGTGHGLGLEVHEPPRLASGESVLKKGTVVTVEPGLYYPGIGGCRIEDVVQVTSGSPRMLSSYPYQWELR